jgi:hypothetical protein
MTLEASLRSLHVYDTGRRSKVAVKLARFVKKSTDASDFFHMMSLTGDAMAINAF